MIDDLLLIAVAVSSGIGVFVVVRSLLTWLASLFSDRRDVGRREPRREDWP